MFRWLSDVLLNQDPIQLLLPMISGHFHSILILSILTFSFGSAAVPLHTTSISVLNSASSANPRLINATLFNPFDDGLRRIFRPRVSKQHHVESVVSLHKLFDQSPFEVYAVAVGRIRQNLMDLANALLDIYRSNVGHTTQPAETNIMTEPQEHLQQRPDVQWTAHREASKSGDDTSGHTRGLKVRFSNFWNSEKNGQLTSIKPQLSFENFGKQQRLCILLWLRNDGGSRRAILHKVYTDTGRFGSIRKIKSVRAQKIIKNELVLQILLEFSDGAKQDTESEASEASTISPNNKSKSQKDEQQTMSKFRRLQRALGTTEPSALKATQRVFGKYGASIISILHEFTRLY